MRYPQKISVIGILLFIVFYCNVLIASNSSWGESNPLTINCNFPTLEFYTCATEFPKIPEIFKDSVSNNNEDEIYFEYIGGVINNPSNPVVITATKILNNPTSCQDSFIVFLEYLIDDGETQLTCTRTLITLRPPINITSPAKNMAYSCEENVDSLFTDWLNNYGYSEYMICFGNIQATTVPENPEINYSCDGTGSAIVRFSLRDGCGNKDTTSAEFIVMDTIPPTITCPQNVTFNFAQISLLSDIDTLLNCVNANDLCSQVNITNDFTENKILYNCEPTQLIPITFVASDKCANTSSCQSFITIENIAGPEIVCPEDLTIGCGHIDNQAIIDNWMTSVLATDFYGELASISINYDNDIHTTNYCDTIFPVDFTALDICARESSCIRNIAINDFELPIIDTCPQAISLLQNDPDLELNFSNWIAEFEAHDSCSAINIIDDVDLRFLEYNCDFTRSKEVHFIAIDNCGNSSECITSVEIINDLEGTITCPPPLDVYCGESGNVEKINDWLASSLGNDNYGGIYSVQNNIDIDKVLLDGCYTENPVQFQFTDRCGKFYSCKSVVTLLDIYPPELTCPSDTLIIGNDEDLLDDVLNWLDQTKATDDCREPFIYYNLKPADLVNCEEDYSIPITIFAKDSCSLLSQCMVTLSIQIDKNPSIICPTNISINCGDPDNFDIIDNWLLGANGLDYNEEILSSTNDFFSNSLLATSCTDSINVIFSVTDLCQRNVTCESKIYIDDNEQPSIVCPTSLNLNSTEPDFQNIISSWLNEVSGQDNCHAISFSNDLSLINLCNSDSVNYVEFSVIDACQLSTSCQSTILVNHDAPSIFCPINLHLICGDSQNIDLITTWLTTSIGKDNSGVDIITANNFNTSSIGVSCYEEIPVEFNVIDQCSRSKQCIANIIIEDQEPPVIECPEFLTILAGNPTIEDEIDSWLNTTIVEDCNNFIIQNDLDPEELQFSCEAIKTIEITIEAVDLCSQASSCITTLKIENDIVAELTCPAPLTLECGSEQNDSLINSWLNTAIALDNLGNTFDVDDNLNSQISLLNECDENIAVDFSFNDLCNNLVQCYSVIQMIDMTPPRIECPENIEFIMESPLLIEELNQWLGLAYADDNCLLDTLMNNLDINDYMPTCEDTVDIIVLFEAYDACNSRNECYSSLSLISESIPSIHCDEPLNVQCGESTNEFIIEQWLNNFGGLDYFGNELEVENNFSMALFESLTCGESLAINFQVTDSCNESTNCVSRINMYDDRAPIIICPDDTTINSTEVENAEILSTWSETYTASDNCSATQLINTLNFDDIDFCNENQMLEVEFTVQDFCGNINSCVARIFLNSDLPQIQCPPVLQLECADSENSILIDLWLNTAVAYDNSGKPIDYENDFSENQISLDCDKLVSVNFISKDNCEQATSCSTDIYITDTTNPDVFCPPTIDLNINSSTIDSDIELWLSSASAIDQCSSTTIEDDFNADLSLVTCFLDVDVTFTAKDECDNQNSCLSQINFLNIQAIEITCPESITLICGDENLSDQINAFIDNYQVESNLLYMVYISPELDTWNLDCEEAYMQSITFEIEDECGNNNSCSTFLDFLPTAKVYIPNAFSPNSDGHNDYFTVFSNESVRNVTLLSIYDRWGNLIFNKSDFPTNIEKEGWSGKSNKGTLVDGVYTYYIELSDIFNNKLSYSGTITLFK